MVDVNRAVNHLPFGNWYLDLIAASINNEDRVLCEDIEQIMRANNGGVLDHIPRPDFIRQARAAHAAIYMVEQYNRRRKR